MKKMTSGQLKSKNSLIWMKKMKNCENSKNSLFSQVRSHRKLQFLGFSEKPSKLMRIIMY